MSILVSKIQELKPDYDYCLKAARKLCTWDLTFEMQKFVYDCFAKLYEQLPEYKSASEEQKYNDILTDRPDRFELAFLTVRSEGRRLKKTVDKRIAKEFAELVELTKELIDYDKLKFKISIPRTKVYTCRALDKVRIMPKEVNGLAIRPNLPHKVFFLRNDRTLFGRDLRDMETFPSVEDVLKYLVQLYDTARSELQPIIKHNRRVMKKMDKVVSGFGVSK